MNIISIGEVLWDVFGDTEHLGGAAFNFGAHAKILGHSVSFISAIGEDPRGQRVLESMDAMGLTTRFVRQVKDHPTGIVTVNLDPQASRISSFTGPLPTTSPISRMGTSENFHPASLTGFISERCFR